MSIFANNLFNAEAENV